MTIYIVTQGSYSSYHIEECFSSRELAEKYIEELRKAKEDFWFDAPDIEEYELDTEFEICDVIRVELKKETPFTAPNKKESVKITTEKEMRNKVFEWADKVMLFSNDTLVVKVIANKNKDLEEEKKRALKVAYDTLNRMKYLYEVLHITKKSEILKILNKEI
jgi:hypothetical protein